MGNSLYVNAACPRDFQSQRGLNFCSLLRLKRNAARRRAPFYGVVIRVSQDEQLQCTWSLRGGSSIRNVAAYVAERVRKEYTRAAARLLVRKWDSKCQLGGFVPRRAMRKLCKSELSSRIDFGSIDLTLTTTRTLISGLNGVKKKAKRCALRQMRGGHARYRGSLANDRRIDIRDIYIDSR